MAIITHYFNGRTDYPDQYMRVDRVDTNKTNMRIEIGVYLNEQMARDNIPPHSIEELYGDFDLYSTKNAWEQAYDRIKQKWQNYTDA